MIINESKRSELPDSAFGIPEDRKFPLDTAEHVKSAIHLFGHAEESKKKALAKRIKSAADKYDIKIKETSMVAKYLTEAESSFDSTVDAKAHIAVIQKVMNVLIADLEKRKRDHDKSKLSEPEKSCYDKYIPLLKDTPFGTKEYVEVRNAMEKDGLAHHFKVNRHHPEHFENGINDMTLVDIVEMFSDWYAASTRSDTGFEAGLKFNRKKFGMNQQLYQIFHNTYKEYFK